MVIAAGNQAHIGGADLIASTATADKNSLDTGTLGFSDLHNEADFKTQHSGISISGAGSFGDQFKGNMPGGMIAAAGNSGHAEGTTQAAVADGTIIIRDKDNQKQDVANLSRDTEHANDSISPIFDKEKEQNRLKEIGMISDIGGQVADIARTQGELSALKAAQDKYGPVPADATEEQRQAYLAKLRDTPEYKKEQEKYGTGSDIQRGIQAATAALQGLAGGNLAGALAGASAPELANFIGHNAGINDNDAAKAIAHAILGGVTAALQGNNTAAGAVGAVSGELIAGAIAKVLYPDVKDLSKLTEDQKQTLSTLASISAGMAGGIAGGNTAGVATGAAAGKNAVENNLLGGNEDTQTKFVQEHSKNIASCRTDPGSASCQKGLAMNDALMVALPAGLGGGVLAAATPEIAAAARAVIAACTSNAVLCLNNAGIMASEAIVPGGVGAGGAIGIGKTVAEVTTAKAIASTIKDNVAASQAARASSNFGQYSKAEGTVQESLGIWPPNRGAYGPIENVTLPTGTMIDRYGYPGGSFVSPLGVPFEQRALPSSYETTKPYFQYEILKPIDDVSQGKILPWFGQKGQGTQYELPKPVQWYLDNDYMKKADK
ncbi:TPA: glycohydrolase toxin TNT-related protein [Klebsiella aerogenes]|nr:glycohydrolase toxin TNT-related protein [Klebsiella aerogenes]ELA1936408.1 glycohydrolase toxin TNT-related protein [Klebsiella aerogenes]ELA2019451.1 glycohydrolase toxin TNT-related protein [Klebsiella aerogenes]QVJ10234.1 glycohydrolase toxin TNT-related protein [Klebsiella sp. A52]HDT6519898.1 glycohydrolase toxin TNT-related protein [Klebsiella aerogenes]